MANDLDTAVNVATKSTMPIGMLATVIKAPTPASSLA
jgi:hypothetical protein